jgi:MarR family transcriptional regulator, lower aerobic nicotinate degradation pathway regulator
VAFLLSQVGFHVSKLWRQRLAPLGVGPREVMLLLRVAVDEGRPQQAFAKALGVSTSRLVAVVDALAKEGLLERRPGKRDRRIHCLYVTDKGRGVIATLRAESQGHEDQVCASLKPTERRQLAALLERIAGDHSLSTGTYAGFSDPSGQHWGGGKTRSAGPTRPDDDASPRGLA